MKVPWSGTLENCGNLFLDSAYMTVKCSILRFKISNFMRINKKTFVVLKAGLSKEKRQNGE